MVAASGIEPVLGALIQRRAASSHRGAVAARLRSMIEATARGATRARDTTLGALAGRARLDPVNVQLLALALAPDLAPASARVLLGSPMLERPTVEVACALFPEIAAAIPGRLSAGARLRTAGLVDVVAADPAAPRPALRLRCPDRVVDAFLGVLPTIDPELRRFAAFHPPVPANDAEALGIATGATALDNLDRHLFDRGDPGLLDPGAAPIRALAAVAARRGHTLLVVDCESLFARPDHTLACGAWVRETLLADTVTLFVGVDPLAAASSARPLWDAIARAARACPGPVAFQATIPPPLVG